MQPDAGSLRPGQAEMTSPIVANGSRGGGLAYELHPGEWYEACPTVQQRLRHNEQRPIASEWRFLGRYREGVSTLVNDSSITVKGVGQRNPRTQGLRTLVRPIMAQITQFWVQWPTQYGAAEWPTAPATLATPDLSSSFRLSLSAQWGGRCEQGTGRQQPFPASPARGQEDNSCSSIS